MAFRVFLLTFLAASMAAIPTGEAQSGGLLGGLGGILPGLLNSILVQGKVFCTLDGRANGTSTPVFPNALVQLQCGSGNVVATTSTNQEGIFGFALNPLFAMSSLLSNCNLAVKTPLSTCNVGLPSVGGLVSQMQPDGNIVSGLLNILKVIPTDFIFKSDLN